MTYSGSPLDNRLPFDGNPDDFASINIPTGYTFGTNLPLFNNFYQLSITGLPGSGGPPAGIGTLIDPIDPVIVTTDVQKELSYTFVKLDPDDEDEGERELVCR